MKEPEQTDPDQIETAFRNGTVTAVSIVLAFSLGFVTQWAANPVPWRLPDLVAVIPLLLGIGLQIKAISDLLDPKCLQRRIFERANRIFMTGLLLAAGGVATAILLDVFHITSSPLRG
ncbi:MULTISPECIES: hypothetical protein [Rhizobium]|uniref:Transmemrbane protein n=1 Tax=Rhizobium aouanii TaxID=3118145 RepID=A0ABU8CJF0_9HYPH|nr:hypothetical protein [Rhizobium acaciae]MCW1410870.1 hypothetical protein [Rhizobium acaciae]MCW1742831.1 hypothetical protein [Rhizobium acaciae]MCW1750027.1 hypothetical protein [Rhizobium acaciae]